MSKRNREKNFWRRYGISNPKRAPETWSRFGAPQGYVTDEDLDHLTQRVKKVEVMVLDENEVTNEGVSFLGRLEYLRELNLKGLTIDDDCLPHLLKLQSLEWLHIKSTRISPTGVEKLLAGLENLKTLIYSLDSEDELWGKDLQSRFPDRELFINYG